MSSFGVIAPPLIGIDIVLVEAVFLAAALNELGHVIKQELKDIRGVHGCTSKADIVCSSKVNSKLDIGFRKRKDGSYECIADWDELEKSGLKREEFMKELSQKYMYLKTVDAAQKEGYQVVEEKNETDGSIRIVLRKFG